MMNRTIRVLMPALALASGGLFAATAARAQDEDYERLVTIMRACSQIDDMVARVTCYDNTVAPRLGNSSAPPPSPAAPTATSASEPVDRSFGAEMLPRERERERGEQEDEVEMRVAGSEQIRPGVYVVTLADGAQWQFTDNAAMTYDPPREGDTVRLERGSLGSVFLHFDRQAGQRVRRIR